MLARFLMVVVDAESDAPDTLEHVVLATRDARRPTVLFADDPDTGHVKDAVAGLAPQRVNAILNVAIAQFAHEQSLRTELAQRMLDVPDLPTRIGSKRVKNRQKVSLNLIALHTQNAWTESGFCKKNGN